jgi:modulator of FtsH protease HflC
MIERIKQSPMVAAILGLAVLIILSMTISVVPETKQAIIVNFGKPLRTINAYDSKQSFGNTAAGLAFRIPFVEQIHFIDKRVLSVEMERQEVQSIDRLRLQVDAFARFRITRPMLMYRTIRTEEQLRNQLQTILESSLRNELGKRNFETLLSAERTTIMENIQRALDNNAKKYGARIIDVRIKGTDLPDGGPLQYAYRRMQSAQDRQATEIDAEGKKQAQIILAEANAQAARLYAISYGKDPDFYDFYRAMQSYKKTLNNNPEGQTSVILSPNNDYLRKFRDGR